MVVHLAAAFLDYEREHGGQVFPAPTDVFFSDTNVVEPDVLFVRAENLKLGRKLALYERFGVPEYWHVDLQAEQVRSAAWRQAVTGPRYSRKR